MRSLFCSLAAIILFAIAGCISDPSDIQPPTNDDEIDVGTDDTSQDGDSDADTDEPDADTDGDTCDPLTCAQVPDFECGQLDNGCGLMIDCFCPDNGSVCTEDNLCECTRPSRDELCADVECGVVEVLDSCGEDVRATCDSCGDFEICGEDNKCQACEPTIESCDDLIAECGIHDDGCGGEIACGDADIDSHYDGCEGEDYDCAMVIDDGSETFECMKDCEPRTCGDIDAECGTPSDGCGGFLEDCGSCDGEGEWINVGNPYNCCNSGSRCTCQDRVFIEPVCTNDFSCEDTGTDTDTEHINCTPCALGCGFGFCL